VINTRETITGDFTRHPDLAFPEPIASASDRGAAAAEAVRFPRTIQPPPVLIGRFDCHTSSLLG